MKSMNHQLRKWNSCSLLDESELLKPEMHGLPSKLCGSAEQLSQMHREKTMAAIPRASGNVISFTEEGRNLKTSNNKFMIYIHVRLGQNFI